MDQYKHVDVKIEQVQNPGADKASLEKKLKDLEEQVRWLHERVEFLQRQDHRSRNSFDQVTRSLNKK
jgi:chaperonin cofactor prefoldin